MERAGSASRGNQIGGGSISAGRVRRDQSRRQSIGQPRTDGRSANLVGPGPPEAGVALVERHFRLSSPLEDDLLWIAFSVVTRRGPCRLAQPGRSVARDLSEEPLLKGPGDRQGRSLSRKPMLATKEAVLGSKSNLCRVFGLAFIFVLDASLQHADSGETRPLHWLFAGRGAIAIASNAGDFETSRRCSTLCHKQRPAQARPVRPGRRFPCALSRASVKFAMRWRQTR